MKLQTISYSLLMLQLPIFIFPIKRKHETARSMKQSTIDVGTFRLKCFVCFVITSAAESKVFDCLFRPHVIVIITSRSRARSRSRSRLTISDRDLSKLIFLHVIYNMRNIDSRSRSRALLCLCVLIGSLFFQTRLDSGSRDLKLDLDLDLDLKLDSFC